MARALLFSGVVAVVWVILAWRSPTLTYHFAPLIAAIVGPLSLRREGRADLKLGIATGTAVLGLLLGVTLLLEVTNKQLGPNFLESGPAWPESVLFSVIGVAVGVRATTRENPGILGRLFEAEEQTQT